MCRPFYGTSKCTGLSIPQNKILPVCGHDALGIVYCNIDFSVQQKDAKIRAGQKGIRL